MDVEIKVPTVLVQHRSDFYKKEFSYKFNISFKSYGVIRLPMTYYEGTATTFRTLFQRQSLLRVLKRLTIG